MSFWTDLLRTTGVITSGVLIMSGVGAPLGLLIGGGVGAVANLGADAINRNEHNHNADQQANQARQNAQNVSVQQHTVLQQQRTTAEASARQQLQHANLNQQIVDCCRRGELNNMSSLFQQLTDSEFEGLSLNLLPTCPNEGSRQQLHEIIRAEENRREHLTVTPSLQT